MAGLMAARVLADGFDAVTVLDRDALPDDSVARRGVPQSSHIHVLMVAGADTLEDLCPGYGADLLSAGGLVVDAARDARFYAEDGYLAPGPRRIPIYCATRPVYERTLRRRVAALDGVLVRPECRLVEYLADEAGASVEGVRVADGGETTDLAADLVVDATGRTSRTPTWLRRHGYPSPTADEVRIDLAYSTLLLARPAEDRRAFVVTPSPPDHRGGAVLPVEGDRWLMTLFGVHGDDPPDDAAGLRAFAAGLPAPDPKRLLDDHPAVSEVTRYRFPANRRYRYERLDRFPEGLVVLGDAVASFNPVYAQGMSVAALESLVLHHALSDGGVAGLAPRFFERASPTIDLAWNMAVGSDHRFPQTEGPKPRGTDLSNRYLARLLRHAHADGALSDAFFRVQTMERRPVSLFRPAVLRRVLVPA